MVDIRSFIGAPLNFINGIKVYPPNIEQATQPRFNIYLSILTSSDLDIKDELSKKIKEGETIPTAFEFLFINSYHEPAYKQMVEEAFMLFTHEKITFLYEQKKILVGDVEEKVLQVGSVTELPLITEENFFDFQNLIRKAIGEKPQPKPEPPDPNEDPRITRMKEKARERDRIKARKGVSGGGIHLSTCLVAICCMGLGITPLNIGEMSYASINPLMTMVQDKEKYDIDIRSLLAGADSKKVKPKYWIKNSD